MIQPRGIYGLFPANAIGDDVELYTDESRTKVLTTLHFLRQQIEKGDGTPNWCLADFIAPKPQSDYIGAFAVTSGHGLDELVEKYKADHDDYNAIMAEALAGPFWLKRARNICTSTSVKNGASVKLRSSPLKI